MAGLESWTAKNLRRAFEKRAARFLEPGETVRAAVGIWGFPRWVLFLTVPLGAIVGPLLLYLLTRRKWGTVAVTDRNVYVFRPAAADQKVIKHPLGSVVLGVTGSAAGRALTLDGEKLYLTLGFINEAVRTIVREAGPAEERIARPVGPLDLDLEHPPKLRGPLAVAVLSVLTLWIYAFFWWYSINRELADFGRRNERPELGNSPGTSLLAITLGLLVIVPAVWTTVTTFKRVQALQRITGETHPINGWIGLILVLVLAPALYAYMQTGLNSSWRAVGGNTTAQQTP